MFQKKLEISQDQEIMTHQRDLERILRASQSQAKLKTKLIIMYQGLENTTMI